MKKNYFMLAAAATLFAACAETDVINDINEKESALQEIGFDAFANKTTRAEITEEGILKQENYGFKVWGYKGVYTVFDGVSVTWRANETPAHWGYDNIQYWDETATYNFYAVAPADGNSSISDGKISINNVTSALATASKDYLIDREGNTGVDGSKKEIQSFDFNHIMAKLSFVLKKAESITGAVTVTSLKMSGWNNDIGNFTQSLVITPTDNSHGEWSFTNDDVTPGTFSIIDSEFPLNQAAGNKAENEYIVVPQTILYNAPVTDDAGTVITPESGLTFTISYKIGAEEFNNQVGVITADQIWGTDTHTTYTITVGPAAIEFDVENVTGFQPRTGSTTIQ